MLKRTQYFAATLLGGILLASISSAHAASLSYSFTGTVDSGALNGSTLNGQLAFDDAGLSHSGFESLSLSAFTLDFLAQSFTLSDADATPSVDFQDGVFLGLSLSISSIDPSFSFISGFIDSSDAYFAYTPISLNGAGFGSLIYTGQTASAVPVPAAIWLLGSALSGLAVFSRRKSSNKLDI